MIALPTTINGYEFTGVLGQGGCSAVYKVFSLKYKEFFAGKVISIDKSQYEAKQICFECEIHALMKLFHPNIIKMYDYFYKNDKLFIILEYCPNGSLDSYIKREGKLKKKQLYEWSAQIVSAIFCCHTVNIAHRDIKLSNFLIDKNNNLKLADFGICAQISNPASKMEVYNGSIAFCPPELFAKTPYDPFKADIWSLGVVLYVMAQGFMPWSFGNLEELKTTVKIANYPILPKSLHEFSQLIKKTLVADAEARSDIRDLIKFNFSQGGSLPQQKQPLQSQQQQQQQQQSPQQQQSQQQQSQPQPPVRHLSLKPINRLRMATVKNGSSSHLLNNPGVMLRRSSAGCVHSFIE